jgi:hypothetical protein
MKGQPGVHRKMVGLPRVEDRILIRHKGDCGPARITERRKLSGKELYPSIPIGIWVG